MFFQWNCFSLVDTCNIALILFLKSDVTKFKIPPPLITQCRTSSSPSAPPLNVWRNLWMPTKLEIRVQILVQARICLLKLKLTTQDLPESCSEKLNFTVNLHFFLHVRDHISQAYSTDKINTKGKVSCASLFSTNAKWMQFSRKVFAWETCYGLNPCSRFCNNGMVECVVQGLLLDIPGVWAGWITPARVKTECSCWIVTST